MILAGEIGLLPFQVYLYLTSFQDHGGRELWRSGNWKPRRLLEPRLNTSRCVLYRSQAKRGRGSRALKQTRTLRTALPSASAHHFLPDWSHSEGQDVHCLGKQPLASPVTRCPRDLFPPDCVTLWLASFFLPSLIWHPWKLALYYRFPAFIYLT